jgi:hypothetical protein
VGTRLARLATLFGFTDGDIDDPVEAKLAAARAARANLYVATRAQALQLSVVARARDITCGVLASLVLVRERATATTDTGRVTQWTELGPDWLARPDPNHTLAWFVSWITDDLFFRSYAYARITVRDSDNQPRAMQWMPFDQICPADPYAPDYIDGVVWMRPPHLDEIHVPARDLVIFESPLEGVLSSKSVLSTAARLDHSADRFAGANLAAGWLKQKNGEPNSPAEAQKLVDDWALGRETNTIGYLSESLDYEESQIDPSRLQLVEGRAYQDAAVARVCNTPNFVVGVGVPNDSMTYKTALTARLDLLDFGLQPYVTCWEQTLSAGNVTPRGQRVRFDLDPFLRTTLLSTVGAAGGSETTPAPGGTSR